MRRVSVRFGREAAFLIAVAALLYLLEASRAAFAAVIGAALLVIAVVELALRRRQAARAGETGEEPVPPSAGELPSELRETIPAGEEAELHAVSEDERAGRAGPREAAEQRRPPAEAGETLPARREEEEEEETTPDQQAADRKTNRAVSEPARDPGEPQPVAGPEPFAPEAGPEPEPKRERTVTVAALVDGHEAAAPDSAEEEGGDRGDSGEAVPSPPASARPVPAPVASAPEPQPAETVEDAGEEPSAESSQVVDLPRSGPQEWNIWELERLARAHTGHDRDTDEERSYLLVYLRGFAEADGVLPVEFDALVRESFGDLLAAAAPR